MFFLSNFRVFSPQTCTTYDRRSPAALRVAFRASGRALLYPQRPQAATRSRARSKKEPKGCRTKRAMKGRCRYAKNAPDDRQFLSSRRHRHRLKIQFEKSNNTVQFARKCISRSSSDGIVHRVDTMRPIGGTTPDFYSVRRPRLFSTTAVHYRRRGSPTICLYFLSSCNSFFHRRRFGCTRARYNRRRVTACPICIPRSKSGRPRRFSVCHWYLFSRSPRVFSRLLCHR